MRTGLIAILCFFIALEAKATPIALAASAQSSEANSSIILARKKKIGRSRFCRAVFSCRATGGWGACMRRKGYSGKSGSGFVCDRNPAARR